LLKNAEIKDRDDNFKIVLDKESVGFRFRDSNFIKSRLSQRVNIKTLIDSREQSRKQSRNQSRKQSRKNIFNTESKKKDNKFKKYEGLNISEFRNLRIDTEMERSDNFGSESSLFK